MAKSKRCPSHDDWGQSLAEKNRCCQGLPRSGVDSIIPNWRTTFIDQAVKISNPAGFQQRLFLQPKKNPTRRGKENTKQRTSGRRNEIIFEGQMKFDKDKNTVSCRMCLEGAFFRFALFDSVFPTQTLHVMVCASVFVYGRISLSRRGGQVCTSSGGFCVCTWVHTHAHMRH